MSQTFIVTTEQLAEAMACIAAKLPAAQFPPEVVELEILRRKDYLTTEEVAKLYPLNAHTLRKRRMNGEGPAYCKDGDRVVYTHTAIRKYLDSRRQKTNDQP